MMKKDLEFNLGLIFYKILIGIGIFHVVSLTN